MRRQHSREDSSTERHTFRASRVEGKSKHVRVRHSGSVAPACRRHSKGSGRQDLDVATVEMPFCVFRCKSHLWHGTSWQVVRLASKQSRCTTLVDTQSPCMFTQLHNPACTARQDNHSDENLSLSLFFSLLFSLSRCFWSPSLCLSHLSLALSYLDSRV